MSEAGGPGGVSLVLGAHYFVGIHVALAVAREEGRLRCLAPDPAAVPSAVRDAIGPAATWEAGSAGDARGVEGLTRAMEGVRTLYHCDEDYRTWARDPREIYRHNVDGTARVLDAARAAGVERVVYTSSVGALGRIGDGTLADEETPARLEAMVGHYQRSKFMADRLVEERVREGAPVVTVHPPASVGEFDLQPTPVGKLIVDFVSGRIPATMESGRNFLDVREAARGHLLAARRGRVGRRYVLGGENLTVRDFLERLGRVTGRAAPTRTLPQWVARAFAATQEARSRFTGRPPRVSIESVRAASQKMFFSTARAEEELGFRAAPLEPSLERAVEWFRSVGLIERQAAGGVR
ncbi:MAG: NAD-dependent epimerase/dehydratase family protein [Longimicrobiales bacterium]|nr:NAD-dependent epimerase/dehydratase family protein [Longimicrobiales bacterium]